MACLSLASLEYFLIWLVLVVGLVLILKLVVPWAISQIAPQPDGGMVMRVIGIIIWVAVVIAIIYLVFNLLSCITGGSFLPLRR